MNENKDIKDSSENSGGKVKSQILAIAAVALVIIIVAGVVIVDKIRETNTKQDQANAISQNISDTLDKNQKEASDIKKNLNKSLVGTYKSSGYSNDTTIELNEDGTITVVSSGTKGWWSSSNKDGVDIVAIIFEKNQQPDIYQVYNSKLLDTKSIYHGDVSIGQTFDGTLTMGNLKLTLSKSGKVNGRYDEKVVQDGVEIPYAEAYGGSYTVDGEYMDLTLNGDKAKFLIFDYEDEKIPDGIASLYYEKIN